jgi:SAM-dependent methyltransferase
MARFYDRASGWVDGRTEFHALCSDLLPRTEILEVGAGPPNPTTQFLATLAEVQGVDPSPEVLENDALTGATVSEDGSFPYPNGSFDACVSHWVLEHVSDPTAHLREVHRVLRPQGIYLFRTVSRLHYVSLVASVTPYRLHKQFANRLRRLPNTAHPWPTKYSMNSGRRLRHLAAQTGFGVEHLRFVEKEPSYGMASRPLFLAFMAYERLVNSTPRLAGLRSNIFGVLRRPD